MSAATLNQLQQSLASLRRASAPFAELSVQRRCAMLFQTFRDLADAESPFGQRVVDRSLLVSEEAISGAMHDFLDQQHALIEGAAGVALAGFQQTSLDYAGKRVVIVLCGANIGIQKLADLLLNAPS